MSGIALAPPPSLVSLNRIVRPAVRTTVLECACLVGAVAAMTACGGDDGGGRASGSAPAGDTIAAAYEGLSKQAAIAKADAADVTWRITREDDEVFMVTQDFDPERVNFEIDDGRVTTASFG